MFAQIGSFIVASGGLGSSGSSRDVLSAPVASGASMSAPVAGPDPFTSAVDKYADYLANPPDNYDTQQVYKIRDWAVKQESRLREAVVALEKAGDFGDRYEEIADKHINVLLLARKARETIEGDESWGKGGPTL